MTKLELKLILMKVRNRLLNYDMVIYQDDDWFKFSLDSVLLADFVTVNLKHKKIMDLCCGNAPIPMLLSDRTSAIIYGVELQKEVYDLGVESVIENNLDKQINLINDDVKKMSNYFDSDFFDIITCNPPYFKVKKDSFINKNDVKAIARHELNITLDDILKISFYLLKNGGYLAMVHRTDRFIEIIEKFKKYNIEPKRIQFIYPKNGKDSDLFLVEGVKNGNIGLKMLSPIIIHNDDNSYTDDINKLLNKC